jgi:transposase
VGELVAAYEAGAAVRELAGRFNLHRATVGRYLKARGIATRPPVLSDEDVSRAAELYRTGWSLAKIANHYDVSAHSVNNYLVAAGVVLRGPHDRVR